MEDFRGYATKNDIRCSDGRVIKHNAFVENDGQKVPLVWQHGHRDIENVLGHAILENREDGVYAYGFINDSERGTAAKHAIEHGDVNSMSIYANKLREKGKDVIHGNIVEVSLVLSGANPGALIENVSIQHSDGLYDESEDEAIIHSGVALETPTDEEEQPMSYELMHEEASPQAPDNAPSGETVLDVFNTLSPKQQKAVYAMIAMAVDQSSAQHSDITEGAVMAHSNVFEQNASTAAAVTSDGRALSHSELMYAADESVAWAIENKLNLSDALAHADREYGISNMEELFPNAKVNEKPIWVKPEDDWVGPVIDGTSHTPFSRLKSMQIDLTEEKLRAKGYIRADEKKEGVFKVLNRETTPQTVYIKSKLDRDDIIDVTEHDIVSYTKEAMRIKFRYELARAILIGDGRDDDDREKIQPEHVRPIYTEDDFYATKHVLPATTTNVELPEKILRAQKNFKGHGVPTMFTTYDVYMDMLLTKDEADSNRRLYKTDSELCAALHVSKIVVVDELEGVSREVEGATRELVGILVNMKDYNIGRDKGGDIFNAEDFDIDFNQYKYLMETRMSGALVEPKTAIVVERLTA